MMAMMMMMMIVVTIMMVMTVTVTVTVMARVVLTFRGRVEQASSSCSHLLLDESWAVDVSVLCLWCCRASGCDGGGNIQAGREGCDLNPKTLNPKPDGEETLKAENPNPTDSQILHNPKMLSR